jgi:hypothetical protein
LAGSHPRCSPWCCSAWRDWRSSCTTALTTCTSSVISGPVSVFAGQRSASASPRILDGPQMHQRHSAQVAVKRHVLAGLAGDRADREPWPAPQGRPGDRAAWPATASVTRSPPTGGAGDLAAPSRRASRRLPGGRPPRPGAPGEVTPCAHHGQLGRGVHGRVAAALHEHVGEPMRHTWTVCPGAVTGTRSSAIQGDGKGRPEPAHARLSAEDRFCGAPLA